MTTKKIEASIKIIIIGYNGVGRTSLLQRFLYNTFNEAILSTGINSANKGITLKNGKAIIL